MITYATAVILWSLGCAYLSDPHFEHLWKGQHKARTTALTLTWALLGCWIATRW